MKKLIYAAALLLVVFSQSCEEPERIAGFEDADQYSIYNYLLANPEKYSNFISILEAGGLDKTLSAYNPDGTNYTLFLPDNAAMDKFIQATDGISSINDILNNVEFSAAFGRYHVVNLGVRSQDFPFGAFPEPTLSEDFLTVSFVIETDTSYYKINNQAGVTIKDIEVSNGWIHEIEIALEPITYTSYDYLTQNSGLNIFKEAMELTGVKSLIDFDVKESDSASTVTLFVEPDYIFNKRGVNSLDDLISLVSPNDNDYTNETNPLNAFCRYHILTGNRFINDFEGQVTNYTTFSEIPLNINGNGKDLLINKGKEVFDTIISSVGDTTIIDYVGFLYDDSNVISQSGSIHFIDQIMTQQPPSRAIRTFEFWEEPFINQYRLEGGTFLIEKNDPIFYINWSGADLYFVELGNQQSSAWGNDYLQIDGDFIISYDIPKIVQGKYTVFLAAEAFSSLNAVVEVYIDGKKVSGLIDLSQGGTSGQPFRRIELGTIDFKVYENHTVEIRPLIPGRFLWDYVRFEPA